MNRVLIIERETSASAPIQRMVEVLNLQPTVYLAWTLTIKLIPLSEVAAVFLNIEMPRIDVKEIVEYFNHFTGKENFKIPVYFLFSQKHIEAYEKIKSINHAGKLSKPFKLEEIYYLLEKNRDLSNIKFEQYDLYHHLSKFEEYSRDMTGWVKNLKRLLKKQ